MASNTIKGLTIELNGDTTGFKAALERADRSIRATQSELKALKESLKLEWDSSKFSKAQDLARKAVEETNQKVEILHKGLAELEKQGLDNTNDDFRKLTKEIAYAENAAKKAAVQLGELSRLRLDNIAKDIDRVGTTLENAGKKALALTAAIGAGFVASSKAAVDYESAFAGVRKTVTATESELQTINDGIREMSKEIPEAATEIAAVAEAAGQLGIKKQSILDFTEVMINLGVATNLTSTDAASSLAKFANITQMAADDYSRLGSVIVALGNNYATTESDIVSMATKLASSGALVGLTESQIMAVAAALSSVGIEAEAGGTAFGKVFKDIETLVATQSDKLKEYADVAGMTAKDFTDAWGRDPIIALSAFIEGLGTLDSKGGNAIVTLEEMGLTEARLSNAILALSGSGDLLTRTVDTANTAWSENTALAKEAEERYKTTESQLQLLKNTLTDTAITIGDDLLPMINNGAEDIKEFAEWFGNLDEGQRDFILTVGITVAALGPMLLITGKITQGVAAAITTFAAIRAQMIAYQAANAGATTSQALFNATLAANPAGAIATVIGILISVVGSLALANALTAEKTEDLADKQKKLNDELNDSIKIIDKNTTKQQAELTVADKLIDKYDELNKKVNKTTAEKEDLARIVEQINNLLPDAIGKINDETGAYETQTEALRKLIEQKRQNVLETAATSKAGEIQSKIFDLHETQLEAEEQFRIKSKGNVSYSDIEKYINSRSGLDMFNPDLQTDIITQYGVPLNTMEELAKLYDQIVNIPNDIQRKELEIERLLSSSTQAPTTPQSTPTVTPLGEPPAPYAITETEDTVKKYDEIHNRKSLELGAGIITQEEYIKALEEARTAEDSYLKERSDAWLKSEAEILASKKKLAEEAAKSDKEAAKQTTAAAKEEKKSATDEAKQTKDEYDSKLTDLKYRLDVEIINEAQYYTELTRLRDTYLAENSDEWKRMTAEIYKYNKSVQEADAEQRKKKSEEDAKVRQDEYAAKKDDLEYYLELDEITEAEYYEEMGKLRDTYLEENSEEWRRVTLNIYTYKREMEEKELAAQKKAAEDALKAQEESAAAVQKQIEDTYNAQIKAIEDALAEKKKLYDEETKSIEEALKEQQAAYKAEYEAKRKQIDSELELERKRINTIIAAIDEEVAARRRLRETESADDKVTVAQKALEAAQLELEYARTEYEKAELTKEVQRRQNDLDSVLQDREDTLFYQQKQDEKDAAQAELDAKTETANTQKDTAEALMESAIAQLEATAKAQLEAITAAILSAEQQAEGAKQAADVNRNSESSALTELENATNYSNKDYIFMTEEQRALQDLVNSVYRSAIATAASVDDVKRATENINSIVNNTTKNANVTLTSTSAPTSGQVALMVEKAIDKL